VPWLALVSTIATPLALLVVSENVHPMDYADLTVSQEPIVTLLIAMNVLTDLVIVIVVDIVKKIMTVISKVLLASFALEDLVKEGVVVRNVEDLVIVCMDLIIVLFAWMVYVVEIVVALVKRAVIVQESLIRVVFV